jgi:hypothetical protein
MQLADLRLIEIPRAGTYFGTAEELAANSDDSEIVARQV